MSVNPLRPRLVIKNISAYDVNLFGRVKIRPGDSVDVYDKLEYNEFGSLTTTVLREFEAPSGEIYRLWKTQNRIQIIEFINPNYQGTGLGADAIQTSNSYFEGAVLGYESGELKWLTGGGGGGGGTAATTTYDDSLITPALGATNLQDAVDELKTATAAGDLSGPYLSPDVVGLQGNPISGVAPISGQVLTWNGSSWVPGASSSSGSGGGGLVYFLNAGTAAIPPLLGIPTSPDTPKALGLSAEPGLTSISSGILSTGGTYDFVVGFITDAGAPGLPTIPAGLWDFNIWAMSDIDLPGVCYFRIKLYRYDGMAPVLISTSDPISIFNPGPSTQYTASIALPQTTISTSDRIYIELEATASEAGHTVTFDFGAESASHSHTTLPVTSGTGILHVIAGVIQSPASAVDLAGGSSEITGVLPVSHGGTGQSSLTSNAVLIGAGGSSLTGVSPGTSGNVLTSDGSSWSSSPVPSTPTPPGGGVGDIQLNDGVGAFAGSTDLSFFSQVLEVNNTVSVTDGGNTLTVQPTSIGADAATLTIDATSAVQVGGTAAVNIGGMYVLPITDGYSGQVMTTDGAGSVSWAATGGGGTVTGVTATAPLASSGGATPAISLTGIVAAANGGTGIALPGALNNVLTSNGAGGWTSSSPPSGAAQGGANAVQYANATTTTNFDGNANFVYTETTGRLGVGTSAPATTLHINSGAVNGTAIATLQNTAGDVQIFRVDATPEGSVTGSVGDIADDSTNGVVYVKTSGSATNTGWSPLANLGTKVYLVVEGGQYATIQAAIDATPTGTNTVPAYSVILVGPKANTGGGASGSWGPAVLAANKSLMIAGLGGAQTSKDIRIDSLTLDSSAAGLNANINENYVSGLYIMSSAGAATTIAAGSNGQALPQATINVASTTGFPASGTLHVVTTVGLQIVTYTGTTATSFTGCSGGTGTLATSNGVSSASSVVTFSGTGAIRLRLNNCYVVNTGAGDGVTNTNSNVSGSLYLDTCVVSAESASGIAVKSSGYTVIRNRSEISTITGGTSVSTGRSLFAPAGVVEIYDCFVGGASVPRPVVEIRGTAYLASGYTTINNTSNDANARCVFINSATATFAAGDASLPLGSSFAVAGQVVSGTGIFFFGNITFSYSPLLTVTTQTPALRTGGWFTTDIKEGISLTSPGNPLFNLSSSGRITRYNDAAPTNGQVLIGNGAATTIAAGSNGQALPQATINVASTTDFPASGTLSVTTNAGAQTVTYTGKTGTSFTGCSGGTGTMSTGAAVTNASSRFDAATLTAGSGVTITPGAGTVTIAAASSLTGASLTGKMIWVDAVNGNDSTATRGNAGLPFLTVEAALAAALSGDVVTVRPGTYDVAATLTLPTGVAMRGYSRDNTIIQKLLVTASTTLLTMGESSYIQDLTFKLTSAGHHTLKGVLWPGTTTATAHADHVKIEVDNSTAGDAGTSNVYGVHVTATSTPSRLTAVASNDVLVNVTSAGLGNKRGVLLDTSIAYFRNESSIYSAIRTGAAAGSYIGGEINIAGGILAMNSGGYEGTSADMSETAGSLEVLGVDLTNDNANGKGFLVTQASPRFTWGIIGPVPSGSTRYLYPGTANDSANEIFTRLAAKGIIKSLIVRSRVAPGGANTDVYTLRKNGVNTAMTVTLTGAAVSAQILTTSVAFSSTDDLSISVTSSGGSAADAVIVAEIY